MSALTNFLSALGDVLSGEFSGCNISLSCMGDNIVFPVTPGSFEVSSPYNNGELSISELGTINMRGKRGLSSVKFASFFPHQRSFFPHQRSFFTKGEQPYNYIEKLKRFADSVEPCRLSISNTRISLYVTIESLNYSEKDGTGDVYFDITLKEYRYLLKDSGESNPLTGLTSRIATTSSMNVLTYTNNYDAMDIATNLTRKILPIHEQGLHTEKVYRLLAKSPRVNEGEELSLSKNKLKIGDENIDY